ncbi:alpha-1,3/4-fucosidase [Elysia marginata]|uniref:alpha-L-fucosidase n=1 Tax=Elysia marginata TaxID=1093978 RepID=A0AAV4FY70_9GAST|nr:alpha-1,3/4-fucosidase [Elysia marginata]
MKKVIIIAKHYDGFCLWQSHYTTHGIMSTNFKGGKGDIVKALSESCQKYGIKLGIYLSPADLYQIESPEGLYARDIPIVATLGAYYYNKRPPQLDIERDMVGFVTIKPHIHKFRWKSRGENFMENNHPIFTIHYTTDGSQPTEKSAVYEKVFRFESGKINAIAVGKGGVLGVVCSKNFGVPKAQWRVKDYDGAVDHHPVSLAFDSNPNTYWQTPSKGHHSVVFDLGDTNCLQGVFLYTTI